MKRYLLAQLFHSYLGFETVVSPHVFNSEQEALDWAEGDDNYKHTAFTIIPHYEYRTVED